MNRNTYSKHNHTSKEHKQGFAQRSKRSRLFTSLKAILGKNNRTTVSGDRRCSSRTTRDRDSVMKKVLTILYDELDYKLTDANNLGEKHVNAIITYWKDKGLKPKTLQCHISTLRTFCGWIGKPGIIHETADYFDSPDEIRVTRAAVKDRSWTSAGVNPVAKIKEIAELDSVIAIQMLLELHFGLRREEAMKLKPHYADQGQFLFTEWGTKGGLPRHIPIVNEAQRMVLDLAKNCTEKVSSSLIPSRYSYKRWNNRYSYIMKRAGITMAANGITSHGLRHEYAHFTYESISGLVAPIRQSHEKHYPYDRNLDTYARKMVSRNMGHRREEITSAYVGKKIPPKLISDGLFSQEN